MSTFFECCKIWLWRNRWLVFRLSLCLRLPVYHLKLYDWVEIWFALNPLFTNRDNIGGDYCCVLKQPDVRYRSPLLGFSSESKWDTQPLLPALWLPIGTSNWSHQRHAESCLFTKIWHSHTASGDLFLEPKSLQTFPAVPEEQHRSSFVVV